MHRYSNIVCVSVMKILIPCSFRDTSQSLYSLTTLQWPLGLILLGVCAFILKLWSCNVEGGSPSRNAFVTKSECIDRSKVAEPASGYLCVCWPVPFPRRGKQKTACPDRGATAMNKGWKEKCNKMHQGKETVSQLEDLAIALLWRASMLSCAVCCRAGRGGQYVYLLWRVMHIPK